MKYVLMSVLCLSVSGCAGVSTVGYEMGGRWHVQRTISDPHAFAPSVQRSWMETCDKNDKGEYVNCAEQGTVQFATTSGYLDGLGAAALYSGAIVGGSALIGNGLKHSGTSVNQNGAASAGQTQTQSNAATAITGGGHGH